MPPRNPKLRDTILTIVHTSQPYTALASVYDLVMEHVDYEHWAWYVHGIIERHHPQAQDVLELACGTGSLAIALQDGRFKYLATDASSEMIRVAREKATLFGAHLSFGVLDFRSFRVDRPADVVLLLYDSINYVLELHEVSAVLQNIRHAVRPHGLLVFDQSTSANSLNNASFFEDHGGDDVATYVRRSQYDEETGLHHTTFDITIDGEHYHEHHVQRSYEVAEIADCIANSGFSVIEALEDFTQDPATSSSERIQWVLRAC